MRHWRTTDVAQLRALSTEDALAVAARLGRSPRAVQDKARAIAVRVPRMPHPRYWPENTRARAQSLRAAGESISFISNTLGVPFGTVRRWIYEDTTMADHIDPQDKIDALAWAIAIANKHAPAGGFDQLDRNRLHALQTMRDQAQRDARGGSQA